MSQNNLIALSAVSDESAVNRLFELMASGDMTGGDHYCQEFMMLNALVYQRLVRNYNEAGVAPAQLYAIEPP